MKENTHKILRIYQSLQGKDFFSRWLDSIKDRTFRARIRRRLDLLEEGSYGDCKSVGDGIHELRLDFGKGYRIYFAEKNNVVIILLCGGDKSTQKKDIKLAKQYWQELQERQNE